MLYLYVFIVLVLILILPVQKRTFKDEPVWRSIGNFLSTHFFEIGNAWSRGETYVWKDKSKARNDFYLNLPDEYPPPQGVQIPAYSSHPEQPGNSAWTVDSEEGKQFWDAMKPYVHDILNDTLEKSDVVIDQSNPVIHFRCSDVPFNRHTWYHFAKWDFYKNALKGYSEVDVLSCHTHAASEREESACKKYIELLRQELYPIKVNVVCGHFIEDFARMFYAPLVISPGSSMSFMSGYFGHGKLITTGHFDERSTDECKICEGDRSQVLLHSEVADYYDVDTVNKMLKGNR